MCLAVCSLDLNSLDAGGRGRSRISRIDRPGKALKERVERRPGDNVLVAEQRRAVETAARLALHRHHIRRQELFRIPLQHLGKEGVGHCKRPCLDAHAALADGREALKANGALGSVEFELHVDGGLLQGHTEGLVAQTGPPVPAAAQLDAVVRLKEQVAQQQDTVEAVEVGPQVAKLALTFGLFNVGQAAEGVVAHAGGHWWWAGGGWWEGWVEIEIEIEIEMSKEKQRQIKKSNLPSGLM